MILNMVINKMENIEDNINTLELLKRHLDELEREMEYLNLNMQEHARAKETLQTLLKTSENNLLISIGANTYIFCNKSDYKNAITSIGSNVFTENKYETAIELLEQRIKDITVINSQLQEEYIKSRDQYLALSDRVDKYYKSVQKKD